MRYYGASVFEESAPLYRFEEDRSRVIKKEPQFEGSTILIPNYTSDIPK